MARVSTFRDVHGNQQDNAPDDPIQRAGVYRTLYESGIQPIGGDQNIQIMQSLQGVVRDVQAAAQEVKNVAQEVTVLAERTFTFMADSTRAGLFAGQSQRLQREGVQEGMAQVIPLRPGAPGVQSETTSYPGQPTAPPQPARTPPIQGTQPNPRESREAQAPTPYDEYQSWDVGRLRQHVAGRLSERIAGWGPIEGDAVAGTPLGRVVSPAVRNTTVAATRGALGQVAEGMPVGQAAGRSVLGALGGGAARTLGIAGAVLTAGNMGLNFLENQRAENAQFQSILGGGNLEGLRERAAMRASRITTRGTLSGEQAEQLFRGTTELGMRGRERREVMDFATQQYRRIGMSISESVQLVATASRNGKVDLEGLAASLSRVTETARAAGLNAEQMRRQFARTFETTAATFGTQTGQRLAGAMTAGTAQLGRQFADVNLDPLAGDLTNVRQQARLMGYGSDVNRYLADIRGRGGERVAARGQSRQLQRFAQRAFTAEGLQTLAAEGQRLRGRNLTEAQMQRETARIGQRIQGAGGMRDPQVAQGILQQMGVTGVDINEAPQYLTALMLGQGTPEAGLTRQERTRERAARGVGGRAASREVRELRSRGFGTQSEREYASLVDRRDRTAPTLRRLTEMAGDKDNMMVRVRAGGETRDVKLSDAIKWFPDQVERGEIKIVEGRGAGQTVRDATGLGSDRVRITSDKRKTARGTFGSRIDLAEIGQSPAETRRKRGRAEETTGSVRIEPAPELKDWLRFRAKGAAYTATTASNPRPPVGEYPSGR